MYDQEFRNHEGTIRSRKVCAPCHARCKEPHYVEQTKQTARCKSKFISPDAKLQGLCECFAIHSVGHNFPKMR